MLASLHRSIEGRVAVAHAKDWNWKRDPNVKANANGGPPPEGHVRRCQAPSTRRDEHGNRLQCARWALTGRSYCARHGGRQPLTREHRMAGFYSKHCSKPLGEKLKAIAETTNPLDRMSLSEEVDLARLAAIRAIDLFTEVCVSPRPDNVGKITDEHRFKVTENMKRALSYAASMVERSARIQALHPDAIAHSHLGFIVVQIGRILERRITDPTIRELVLQDIKDMPLPSREKDANVSLTEQAAQARQMLALMDASVVGSAEVAGSTDAPSSQESQTPSSDPPPTG